MRSIARPSGDSAVPCPGSRNTAVTANPALPAISSPVAAVVGVQTAAAVASATAASSTGWPTHPSRNRCGATSSDDGVETAAGSATTTGGPDRYPAMAQ